MHKLIKRFSPGVFALILICFLMPFITLSCQSQPVARLTGLQLATGTEIAQANPFTGQVRRQKVPLDPAALLALAAAAAGLAGAFVKAKQAEVVPAASGALGFVMMLWLKTRTDDAMLREGQGVIQVNYDAGFWLVFWLFLASAIAHGWDGYTQRQQLTQKAEALQDD